MDSEHKRKIALVVLFAFDVAVWVYIIYSGLC